MESISEMYVSGMSIPQISDATGICRSTVRHRLLASGVTLRSRAEGVRDAAKNGRLGSGLRGKSRQFSDAHRQAISDARSKWGDKNAKGTSLKQNGYLEYTTGPHKGRLLHVVKMEEQIGRRLKRGECVHHIDENKLNNDLSNLALMTVSAHAKLHRIMDAQRGKVRERDKNGRFS